MSQMACKDNEGDFQRAVVMSGMFGSPYEVNEFFLPQSLEEAGKKGERLFDHLGVKTLEEARKLDAGYIRSKYSELRSKGEMFFTIVQDGRFCTQEPMAAFRNGTRIRVPVMGGNTGDEFIEFIHASDDEELSRKAKEYFGTRAEEFLSFPEARVKTDLGYSPVSAPELGVKDAYLGENRQNDPKNCYYYRFIADIPGEDDPGTFHSVDLWFFFETLDWPNAPDHTRADIMIWQDRCVIIWLTSSGRETQTDLTSTEKSSPNGSPIPMPNAVRCCSQVTAQRHRPNRTALLSSCSTH